MNYITDFIGTSRKFSLDVQHLKLTFKRHPDSRWLPLPQLTDARKLKKAIIQSVYRCAETWCGVCKDSFITHTSGATH